MESIMNIEKMKEFIDYDPETGDMTWVKVLSNRAKAGDKCGRNVDAKGYGRVCFDGKQYRAHRVAWALHYGSNPDGIIDHINGNRLDNRISNLRIVDTTQNARNTGIGVNNTSGAVGVVWHKTAKKWVAQITVNRENKYLGLFADFNLARQARLIAEEKYFGQFARSKK
jgi:hypothetical protein